MPAFCAACGGGLDDNARFCTGCGAAVPQPTPAASEAPTTVSDPAAVGGANGDVGGPQPVFATATAPQQQQLYTNGGVPPQPNLGQPTAQVPPAQPAPSYVAPPPPPPLAPTYFAAPPPQQPPPAGGSSKGLIAGLAAALALVISGIVVAVLLASSGSSSTPTVAAATPTASSAAPSNVTTVTRIIERPAKSKATKKKSSSSSSSSTGANASVPASTVHRQASTSSFTDKAEIRGVLQRHWSAIRSGNYSAAFALLVPGSQSQSSWISAHEQDALTNESLSLGTPSLTSSTTATAPVSNLHTEAASGCFNWSGYYEMQKVGGDWRIGKAKISRSAC